MNTSSRLLVSFAVVLGALLGLGFLHPALVNELGLDVQMLAHLEDSAARERELDAVIATNRAKSEKRRRLLQELIDQQRTLAETIVLMRQTWSETELAAVLCWLGNESDDIDLATGRWLLLAAKAELQHQPDQAATVLPRLEYELKRQFPQSYSGGACPCDPPS